MIRGPNFQDSCSSRNRPDGAFSPNKFQPADIIGSWKRTYHLDGRLKCSFLDLMASSLAPWRSLSSPSVQPSGV